MIIARVSLAFISAAALAACSGNLGSGQSTLPGMPQGSNGTTNVQQVANAAPTATPNSMSGVVTLGDSTSAQALPAVMGYGGSIAFPKPSAAPSATPNPKTSAAPADAPVAASLSIGVTASTVEPSDAPHFSALGKHRGKHDSGALTPLLFITLLAPSDVTLPAYPRIAVDVPRDIAAKYRDDTYGLALYDPEAKDKVFRLGIADRDLSSPAPETEPTPAPTPVPVATPLPNNGQPIAFTPPPIGAGLSGTVLPPERVAFAAPADVLVLRSNRPAVFALYAIPPHTSPSPSPSPSPTAPGGSPAPQGTAAPSPAASLLPVPAKT